MRITLDSQHTVRGDSPKANHYNNNTLRVSERKRASEVTGSAPEYRRRLGTGDPSIAHRKHFIESTLREPTRSFTNAMRITLDSQHTVVPFAEGEYYNTIPYTLRAKRVLEVTATRLYDSMVRYNRDAKRRKRLATAPGYRRRLGTGGA